MGSMEDVIQMRRDSFPSQGSSKRRRTDLGEITARSEQAVNLCPDGVGYIECFRNKIAQKMGHMSESDVVSFPYAMYSTLQGKVTLEIQDDLRKKDSRQIGKFGELKVQKPRSAPGSAGPIRF